jgi:hypothetical protein
MDIKIDTNVSEEHIASIFTAQPMWRYNPENQHCIDGGVPDYCAMYLHSQG